MSEFDDNRSHSDDRFARLFSEKMSQFDAPDFSENDWPALDHRLSEAEKKRWRLVPMGWLWGLTGLLVLSNLVWFTTMRNLGGEVERLKYGSAAAHFRDTIFEKTVVVERDTVWIFAPESSQKTTAKRGSRADFLTSNVFFSTGQKAERESENGLFRMPPAFSDGFKMESKNAQNVEKNAFSNQKEAHSSLLDTFSTDSFYSKKMEIEPLAGLDLEPLKSKPRRLRELENDLVFQKIVPQKRRSVRFGGSLEGGFFEPTTRGFSEKSGWLAGGSGDVFFNEKWSLSAGMAVGRISLKTTDPLLLGIENLETPGPEWSLKYIETKNAGEPIRRFSIRGRRFFGPSKWFQPLVGLGLVAHFEPAHELEVEFFDAATGMEFSKTTAIAALSSPIWQAEAELGFQISFHPRASIQLLAFRDWRLGKGLHPGNFQGLRLGVSTRF